MTDNLPFSKPTTCSQCGYVLPAADEQEGEILCPACLLESALELDGPCEEECEPESCGPYVLYDRIGRGGMGTVFRARKHGTSQDVALKMISADGWAEPDVVLRFRQEVQVIARLNHPNIVTVDATGETQGRAWFVMPLAEGGSLAERLGRKPAFTQEEAAHMVFLLAGAVECAHRNGVLHRDLKPANILLTKEGVPWVSDFGLARLALGPAGVTLTGSALGTPAYMAPEQASGLGAVTTAADVYGLGAILFHLLAGKPPFSGASAVDVLQKVIAEDAMPLQNCGVSADLATVCAKAMAKDPGRRYRSAAELADDLRRWLEGDAVLARPISWAEKLWRWAKRNPAKASLIATSLAGVTVFAVLLAKGYDLLRAEHNMSLREAQRAEASEHNMALQVYAADLFAARRAYEDGHLGSARATLDRHLPQAGSPDLRGFEWHLLHNQCRGNESIALANHQAAVPAVAFTADGSTAISGSRDGILHFWSVADAKPLRMLPATPQAASIADFAELAALPIRCPEVPLAIANGISLAEMRMRARPSRLGSVNCLACSKDGKWIVTGGEGVYVRLWRARDMVMQGFIPVAHATQVGFSSDSKEIFLAIPHTSVNPPEIRRYAVETLSRLEAFPAAIPHFALATAVQGLCYASKPDTMTMRSVDGKAAVSWQAKHPITSLAISPDGAHLALFAETYGTLYRAENGAVLAEVKPGHGQVRHGAFSDDGKLLAIGTAGQVVTVFDVQKRMLRENLRGHTGEVLSVAFRPGSHQILSGSTDPQVRLWMPQQATRPECLVIPQKAELLVVSPDGVWLAGRNRDRSIVMTNQKQTATLPLDHVRLPLAFQNREGQVRLLTRRLEEPILEWWHTDGSSAAPAIPLDLKQPKYPSPVVSGDARVLVANTVDKFVQLHDTSSGKCLGSVEVLSANIESMSVSADGSLLVAREYPRTAVMLDLHKGTLLWRERLTSGTLGPMVFSPDSSLLATGADDALITIRNSRSGAVVTTLKGHLTEISKLAFTLNGQTLASTSKDGTLRFWHTPTWRSLGAMPLPSPWGHIRFAPQGLYTEEMGTWLLVHGGA